MGWDGDNPVEGNRCCRARRKGGVGGVQGESFRDAELEGGRIFGMQVGQK